MRELAETRTDPADLINAAVDSLIRNRYELPALMTLRRLAGTVHNAVNTGQWKQIITHLSEAQRAALENLLAVNADTHQSSFADLCRSPGRASRKNLTLLISRYQWLLQLPNPSASLACVATSKILQWANEARRLKAKELREYVVARRHALLLAVIYQARGQVLDDLTQMLLRLARKIERKSHERLTEFYESRRNETDTLIRAFRDVLIVFGDDTVPALKVAHLDQILAAAGEGGRWKTLVPNCYVTKSRTGVRSPGNRSYRCVQLSCSLPRSCRCNPPRRPMIYYGSWQSPLQMKHRTTTITRPIFRPRSCLDIGDR